MSVESDLKKDGIIVIKKLNTLKVNSIARNVDYAKLFLILILIKMIYLLDYQD